MSVFNGKLFTKRLTAADSPFTIDENSGITKWSMRLVSGAATLTGTKKIGSMESDAIDLVEGVPVNAYDEDSPCCFTLAIAGGGIVDFMAG